MPDERVLDVQSTDDALSVSLRDGRVITVPLVPLRVGRLSPGSFTARERWLG